MKNFLSFVLRIGISGVVLYFLFKFLNLDIPKIIALLKAADLVYVFYAGIIFLIIHGFLIWRWLIFIRAVDLSIPIKEVIRYFGIGLFGNLFLPSAIGGDVIKIIGLCKTSSRKSRIVASILLDRLCGFASIALVATSIFFLGYQIINDSSLLIPIIVLGGSCLGVAVVLFNERIYSFFCKIFNFFPKIKNSFMAMHHDIALLKDKPKEGYKAIGISCLCQILFAFTWLFLALALNQDVAVIYFIVFVPLLCVITLFPSIGGLGVREAGSAYLFVRVGMDSGVAVSLSLIIFLFMIFVGLIGAGVYVFTLSSGRVQYNSSNTGQSQSKA